MYDEHPGAMLQEVHVTHGDIYRLLFIDIYVIPAPNEAFVPVWLIYDNVCSTVVDIGLVELVEL